MGTASVARSAGHGWAWLAAPGFFITLLGWLEGFQVKRLGMVFLDVGGIQSLNISE